MMSEQMIFLLVVGGLLLLLVALTSSKRYSLNRIKAKTVGDGQYGTTRWATPKEVQETFAHVPFQVKAWRSGQNRPKVQGLVLGSTMKKKQVIALVDSDDIHCLMIGASGVGKTAFFLYPNLEYACACGMSYLALDTKGGATRCDTRSALQAL